MIDCSYQEFLTRNKFVMNKHEARVLQAHPEAKPFAGMMGWGIEENGVVLSMGRKTMEEAWAAA